MKNKNEFEEMFDEAKELAKICCPFQLWFPFLGRFYPKTRTETQFRENLFIARLAKIETFFSFSYRVKKAPWQQHLALVEHGDVLVSQSVSVDEVAELMESLDVLCACGQPATVAIDCSCGNYAWCDNCLEFVGPVEIKAPPIVIFLNHVDHNCSPECCARGHTAPKITVSELRAMVNPLETKMEKIHSTKRQDVFLVYVRPKSKEEILKEMRYCAGNYSGVIGENGEELFIFQG